MLILHCRLRTLHALFVCFLFFSFFLPVICAGVDCVFIPGRTFTKHHFFSWHLRTKRKWYKLFCQGQAILSSGTLWQLQTIHTCSSSDLLLEKNVLWHRKRVTMPHIHFRKSLWGNLLSSCIDLQSHLWKCGCSGFAVAFEVSRRLCRICGPRRMDTCDNYFYHKYPYEVFDRDSFKLA